MSLVGEWSRRSIDKRKGDAKKQAAVLLMKRTLAEWGGDKVWQCVLEWQRRLRKYMRQMAALSMLSRTMATMSSCSVVVGRRLPRTL